MNNSTPRPWFVGLQSDNDGNLTFLLCSESTGSENKIIGRVMSSVGYTPFGGSPVSTDLPAEANAELIVRAVNSHEYFVDAAKAVLACFEKGLVDRPNPQADVAVLVALNKLELAVALANGPDKP